MATVKKKIKTGKYRLSKSTIIFVSILGVMLLLIGALALKSYLVERQTLAELVSVGKELKIIYNNLLEYNKGNTAGSYFRNDCSIGHTSWLEERVSCGPSGRIVLQEPSEIGAIKNNLIKVDKNSELRSTTLTSNGQSEVNVNLELSGMDIKCYAGYSKNQLSGRWEYWMTCRKEVPRVLPNYTIEK